MNYDDELFYVAVFFLKNHVEIKGVYISLIFLMTIPRNDFIMVWKHQTICI